jgi:hypothetical protein
MRILNESDWLFCHDPDEMLRHLRSKKHKPSLRKLRLLAVAACRGFDTLLDTASQQALDVAERHADGQATDEELSAAHEGFLVPNWPRPPRGLSLQQRLDPEWQRRKATAKHVWTTIEGATRSDRADTSKIFFAVSVLHGTGPLPPGVDPAAVAAVIREVFGSPFHPVEADGLGSVSTASKLAATIYDERAWDRMPILADALEEAACSDAELLQHLRCDGRHVRGCWALDAVLGKE